LKHRSTAGGTSISVRLVTASVVGEREKKEKPIVVKGEKRRSQIGFNNKIVIILKLKDLKNLIIYDSI